MTFLSWFRDLRASSPQNIERALQMLNQHVFSLSADAAQKRAVGVLRAGDQFRVEMTSDVRNMPPFSGETRAFFEQFPRVEGGEVKLDATNATRMHRGDPHWVIGSDLEHALVVVSANSDQVWVLEPHDLEKSPEQWPPPYPTVWHYLLVVSETARKNWWNTWLQQ